MTQALDKESNAVSTAPPSNFNRVPSDAFRNDGL